MCTEAEHEGSDKLLYGILGTSITGMGMLSRAGRGIANDEFGQMADNAGGIEEKTGMGEDNRKKTDEIGPNA